MGRLVDAHVERGGARAAATGTRRSPAGSIDADRAVNQMELAIDELCIRILALYQPAASDLRFIAAALKIVTDLERIGDLAVNMAERVQTLAARAASRRRSKTSRAMAAAARTMLREVLEAFVAGDTARAEAVIAADAAVDARIGALLRAMWKRRCAASRTPCREAWPSSSSPSTSSAWPTTLPTSQR